MKYLTLLFLCLLCISCAEEVKVTVVNDTAANNEKIVFNDNDTLTPTGLIDSIFLTEDRQHNIFYKGKNDVLRTKNGGILNLGKKEFVVVAIRFEATGPEGDQLPGMEIQVPNFTIIDSSLIFKSEFSDYIKTENDLTSIVDSVMSYPNNNYMPDIFGKSKYQKDDYDSNMLVNGFKKISSQKLFIEKFWDYDLGAPVPEEISINIRSESQGYNVRRDQKAIMLAEHFLAMAKESPYDYIVVDISQLLKKKK